MAELRIRCDDEEFLPTYGSKEAAGADVRAAIPEPKILNPSEILLVPTGIKLEIPEGYEVQIRPRSGLALKHGITVLNTPGTIDSDYRGEIQVILINHGKHSFEITPKMRIAQLILSPIIQANFVIQKSLSESERGEGAFGHTGLH